MPVPLLHTTDLFHPPADPDDHFDLATAFSLAVSGRIDLRGVVIDHPPSVFPLGEPAVTAVAQLNRIAGTAVPVATGAASPTPWADNNDPTMARAEQAAANFILQTLRRSNEPVAISVVGSCVDLALAARLDADVFARKCAAVYLNAGLGLPDAASLGPEEYNTSLSPTAYAAMFDLPCPLYWLPCMSESADVLQVGTHGTYYRLKQADILPALSPAMQAYFVFALSAESPQRWLSHLENGVSEQAVAWVGKNERNMWSTAGFLHAAGLGVNAKGDLVDFDPDTSVFRFDGVQVSCDPAGATKWSVDPTSSDRFLFHITDLENYQQAMRTALGELLRQLS